MKFFRLDLLTLLISLFILNSCKNQDTIGLPPGASGLSGSLVDTATIFTNTVAEDSVPTSALAKTPLGFINDPIFGTTESSLITDLNLPAESSYTPPVGTILIDSAVLVLKYAQGFYGDSASYYTANVYQLNERQYTGQSYYSNKTWNYNPGTLLGSRTFRPTPSFGKIDSVHVDSIIAGRADSLIKVSPQIRIPISTAFIRNNLFQSSSAMSNLVFKNLVKGFFINIDKSKVTGTGATIMLKADSSVVDVFIRTLNGSVIDTSVVELPIVQHAAQIKHVYSTTVQNALNLSKQNAANHTNISDSLLYLQGTASLKSKISFPYLASLFKTLGTGNVIINRAELVVTPNPAYVSQVTPASVIPQYLKPLPKLTLYRYDIAHRPIAVEDAATGTSIFFGVGQFGGYLQVATAKSPQAYHFLVTGYIQDLLAGRTIDYGTYIAPVDTTNISSVDIAPTPQTAARTVAGGGSNKSSPYHIKLNVIYTKTNK